MMELLKNKKMFIPLFVIIGIFIIVLILTSLPKIKIGTTKLTNSELENKIAESARLYYESNSDFLPKSINEEVEIDTSILIENKFLKELNKYTKSDVTCNGKAMVRYTLTGYTYKGYLDCGSEYKTQLFTDTLKANIVTSGNGLYKVKQYNNSEAYIFKGENINNYVRFGEKEFWRIVKVDADGDVMLIGNEKITTQVWDDRYNINTDDWHGINDYLVSRIKDSLAAMSNSSDLYQEIKPLLTAKSICIGARKSTSSTNNGNLECSKTYDNQFFSLLPAYDYVNASWDSNCRRLTDISCSNYNYLSKFDSSWWLLTADSQEANKVFYVNNESIDSNWASNSYRVRPVVYLDSSTVYVSGTGTDVDPYIVK